MIVVLLTPLFIIIFPVFLLLACLYVILDFFRLSFLVRPFVHVFVDLVLYLASFVVDTETFEMIQEKRNKAISAMYGGK